MFNTFFQIWRICKPRDFLMSRFFENLSKHFLMWLKNDLSIKNWGWYSARSYCVFILPHNIRRPNMDTFVQQQKSCICENSFSILYVLTPRGWGSHERYVCKVVSFLNFEGLFGDDELDNLIFFYRSFVLIFLSEFV